MRMIEIETYEGTVELINPEMITRIYKEKLYEDYPETVNIEFASETEISTKFTTIDYALDYIQRAPSHSPKGG